MDSSDSGLSYKKQKINNSEKDLDCSNAARGVWLVKVPKYISSLWEKAPPLSEAGRLKITRTGGKADIKFSLSDDMLKTSDGQVKTDIPKEHRFVISNIAHQTLAVFGSENGDSSDSGSGKLVLGGHVLQKGECRPLADQRYMNLKRESILKASQPERQVKQITKVVTSYKPVSDHKFNIEYEQKKKAEGRKARDDKDKVMDMLFAAFEKHQYYNIKDLEKITRQPVPYLKEILKEICNYNAKNPHKSTWELKPEYRHYKASESTE
ncbi:general transcription factor IIF subunit 2-like isoform X2 [Stegodyphus dumicola]|uniref:general transcription factor IIF subunit 2-like isoform X2 n=1 Tax=Stegodyphus dumicola TaxID=202533 RepID=UPI0015A94457|nr:general transcription factor IIF subunit 2-like isoform X2 [Stegodyphus dumicola]